LDILIEELDESLWVAAVSGHRLDGLEVDPVRESVRFGSIYWGRVTRIDKAMDAVYVDLDGETTGILNNADVRIVNEDGSITKGGDESIGKLIQPGQMIAVQAKSGHLPTEEEMELALESKSPRVSMDITLQGRYLIFSPIMPENRVSSRITDRVLRKQLLKMLNSIDLIKGCILRAAAADMQTDILIREAKILGAIWSQLQPHFEGDETALIMEGPNAIQRTIGDHAGKRIERIEITTMDHYQVVEEWCELFAPDLVTKIHPIELKDQNAELALFDERDIIGQVEDLFQPYALLSRGGNIIIQETAALIAIDINRGADDRSNLEINLEAANEIGRQLRLRNLGGIVVIDFLKLKTKPEQKTLLDALGVAFESDPCTVQIHGMTALGLVEVTRKKRSPTLHERFDSALE
jgi:Rne/Rng family ribonuclease